MHHPTGQASCPRAQSIPVRLTSQDRAGDARAVREETHRGCCRQLHSAACIRRRRPLPPGRTSSTPASCWPTRRAAHASTSMRSFFRSWSSPSSRASAPIPSSATSPAPRCGCSTSCACCTAGSTSACRSVTTAARCGSSSTTATPRCCRPASGSVTTTRASSRSRSTCGPRAPTSRWSPRTSRCGSRRRRSGCTAEEYRAELAIETGYTGMARWRSRPPTSTTLYDEGVARPRARPRAALPLRPGAALRARERARPGHRRQAGQAGPWRPRGVRAAWPLGRAAGRARPPARPRHRHRVARRTRRHRQVRPGPVRRTRGRARATPAQARSWCSGRCSPSAARSSATCPAASRRRCSPGPRRSSTPSVR